MALDRRIDIPVSKIERGHEVSASAIFGSSRRKRALMVLS